MEDFVNEKIADLMAVFKARNWILNGTSASTSKSLAHTILIENGFVSPASKGLYSILPLGQRVIDKLVQIIDREFQSIGALKISMPIIGTKSLWEKTKRWEAMGPEMMTFEDRGKNELCLQPTAEEMCTELISRFSPLKKNLLPLMVYQIGEKFRDEMNPRFGLMRSRQFLMKDLYSFDTDSESARKTYRNVCEVYDKIFKQILDLDIIKVEADSGVHGGQLSHEYHLISNLEEDFVEICETCGLMSKGENSCEKCGTMKIKRSTVEVGHTFHLGTKYSKVFGANFAGKPLDMCCFGIGVSRLLPALVDNLTISKEAIRLPSAICPFDAVIIVKKSLASNVLVEMTISSIKRYLKGGILLDDRIEMSPGKRIHEANRLGAPFIIVLANETERSLSINKPVIEIFTTKPKSCEVLSHGSMSLKKLVTFVQSKSGQLHQTNQILTEMSSNQRAQSN